MPKPKKILLTVDDVEEAREAWRRDAPPRFRTLLEAEPVETRIDKRRQDGPRQDQDR